MKKLNLLALAIIIATIAITQNWQPINPGFTYFYKIAGEQFINESIKVDSVKNITGHQVYYLNMFLRECDTCENIECNQPYQRYNTNHPSFLQKKIHVIDDETYLFLDPESFVVKPLANLNETWIFDTILGINATVISLSYDQVFEGIYDSVKQIDLSNGTLFKLSQNFGIISFPDFYDTGNIFHLAGGRTEEGEFGEEVADFWDYYDFQVGDIFCTYYSYSGQGYELIRKKIEIVSKEISGDTIKYGRYGYQYDSYSGSSIIDDVATYTNDPKSYLNTLPGQLEPDENSARPANFRYYYMSNLPSLTNDTHSFYRCGDYDFLHYDDCDGPHRYNQVYSPNLGKVFSYFIDYMYWTDTEYKLTGYIRNGDTVGTIYHDSIFGIYGTNNYKIQNELVIYPNPTSDLLTIKADWNILNLKVQLHDLSGRTVLKQFFHNKLTIRIDLSHIPSGSYILRLEEKDKVIFRKVLKQ